ncbi:diguanylate cyclase domain-containing protein [Crocosphaera chwakensis]|uniref:Uncharacterized protein n=1 Tax=Crocosphaera chwakensis CCY0110 TaxID=391612 RepID=A3IYP6_9CHRO|nr:diguanylate cyclase [Crocosphaera chwakensis]EAZ88399.1 hypothetical protein CY0110_05007 [Crocosphaera chwakensis CCY0110]
MIIKPAIICIDDEPIILHSLREQISRGIGESYQIEIAESGQEALELCAELTDEKIPIPLVVCDHFLPGMLGSEILCQLHHLYPHTLKILLTGQASFEGVIKAVNQANLYRYIAKPWNEIDLTLTIKEALRSYEQSQQLKKQNQVLQKINQELQIEIQERKHTEQLLKASEFRLESILNSINDIIWSASPKTLELLYLSPSAEQLYGYPLDLLKEQNFWRHELVHPEDRETVKRFMPQVLAKNHLTINYKILQPNEKIQWVKERAKVIYDERGNAIRIDGTIYNVTQQKLREEKLVYNSLHDSLTKLPNRAFFSKQLDSALKRAQCDHYYQFAVLFIDLDGFKTVNDSLGHEIGYLLLIAIAKRLQNCVRNSDLVARLGGDEFTIFLSKIEDRQEVSEITERILSELSRSFCFKNHTLNSGASIGIVMGCSAYTNQVDLLRDADSAMYQAKNAGKGRYVILN